MKSLINNVIATAATTIARNAVKFEAWSKQNPKKAAGVIFVVGCAEGMMWNKTAFKKLYSKHPKTLIACTVLSSAAYSLKYYQVNTKFSFHIEPMNLPTVTPIQK